MTLPPTGFLRICGSDLEYRFIGPATDAAPTIVMLHEGLGSVGLWGDIPEKLQTATGCGVSAWIREQRLKRALGDLRQSSDASVASIATRWGYRDPASFSRAFRQTYGSSPRDLRRGA